MSKLSSGSDMEMDLEEILGEELITDIDIANFADDLIGPPEGESSSVTYTFSKLGDEPISIGYEDEETFNSASIDAVKKYLSRPVL